MNTNQEIIEDMFKNYGTGNMAAVIACFDKDIVWIRPGAPAIPFSGIFTGLEEVMKMFAVQATTISIKTFVPEKICTNEDTVVVLGHDVVDVIATGKSYSTDWVQAYTLKEAKIINVRVYLDTKAIAEAFQS
jgi:uncharacterized protein